LRDGEAVSSGSPKGPDGQDRYNNRAVLFVDAAWGRIRTQEDYEDRERAAEFAAASEGLIAPFGH